MCTSYMSWQQIRSQVLFSNFINLKLLCFRAFNLFILYSTLRSIRHLQEAANVDGKAAINLQKLKIFRHFYIMVNFKLQTII